MAKLKQEVLSEIKSDSDLWSLVADKMGIKPISLGQMLQRNGATLNQYSVVKAIADYLGLNPQDIVEEETIKIS